MIVPVDVVLGLSAVLQCDSDEPPWNGLGPCRRTRPAFLPEVSIAAPSVVTQVPAQTSLLSPTLQIPRWPLVMLG